MARARKTEEQHWLQGSKPEWSAPDSPSFAGGKPKMPKELSPVAQAEWKRLVKHLQQRGTLTRCDASALEIYCETYARWRQCLADIAVHGPVIETTWTDSHGTEHEKRVPNPAAKLAAQLETSMRQMLKEFSATPASREKSRPAAPETPKDENPEGSVGWLLEQQAKGNV
jgi:P27 family predicted phage terminase small subunit